MQVGFELSYTPTNFRILINQIDIKKYVPFEYRSVQNRDKSLQRILLPSLSLSLPLSFTEEQIHKLESNRFGSRFQSVQLMFTDARPVISSSAIVPLKSGIHGRDSRFVWRC